MGDSGILILTVIFSFMIILLMIIISRSCYKLRDNSKHMKRHANTPDTRRKDAVTQSPVLHIGPRQEEEWRRQDAERRRRLEVEVQRINHLFNEDTFEEHLDPQQFKLPSRLNRLDGSSSSTDHNQSYIRAECSLPRRPPRKTRRHREQWGKREGNTVVALYKTPGLIQLQGPLAQTNDGIIYCQIQDELEYHRNIHPNSNIHTYLNKKFELSRKDDMAVMSLIQGTDVALIMTGNVQQAMTRYKQLLSDIHTYNLRYPAIAESQLYWYMYMYYMHKGKPGKVHSVVEAAVSCIQHQAPSTWTARVCDLQGAMYDRLAQVRPGHRSKYQDLALRCFTQAREHYLYQACQEVDYLYYPLFYTLATVLIKLHMPTLHTISSFRKSDIVYQRLSECLVTERQVTEAQDLVTSVTSHLTELTAGARTAINECILICTLIVNIRLTQLAIRDKTHHSALSFMKTAYDMYHDWSGYAIKYKNTRFERYPHLACDIKTILDTLSGRLRLTSPPASQPDPLSDSLSSEPSDAPPSGLKQLTEESRRAEKQARRDAHQFSYSSGDIYSDSNDDVSTDLN